MCDRIISQGIDLVLVERIARLHAQHGARFLDRIYSPAEQQYCLDMRRPETRLAGRFAVKEAVLKVLGTGWRGGIEFRDIETLPDPLGKPLVTLHNATAAFARHIGIDHVLASISHAGDYAIAVATGIARELHPPQGA